MPTITYSIDYERAGDALAGSVTQLRDAIAKAIATERERCALVVENMGRRNGRISKAHKVIAAELRSARTRIGKQQHSRS
jgi:hypothetical protein